MPAPWQAHRLALGTSVQQIAHVQLVMEDAC